MTENQRIQELFNELHMQREFPFPQHGKRLIVPREPGVYIIRRGKTVLHVGRTVRARGGLHKRLTDHLHGSSSFTKEYLEGNGERLRDSGHSYQYLEVQDPRLRALLEAYAIGSLFPRHLGLGRQGCQQDE